MQVAPAPDIGGLISRLKAGELSAVVSYLATVGEPVDYPHWDRIRHVQPPAGLSVEGWWLAITLSRRPLLNPFGLRDGRGRPFVVGQPLSVLRRLHRVGRWCAQETEAVSDADSHVADARMDEAIHSARIAGGAMPEDRARDMLRRGRSPRTRDERLVANLHRADAFLRDDVTDRLRPEDVLEAHRIATRGTLDDAEAGGRLRQPVEDGATAVDPTDGSVVHVPPPADGLPERLEAMCAFACAPDDEEPSVHPIARAILVELWLVHDRPFAQANGRVARLLLRWCMRAGGRRRADHLAVSAATSATPERLVGAFAYAATDGLDATYAVVSRLDAIQRALATAQERLDREALEAERATRAVTLDAPNSRQRAVVTHALRHPDARYTYASHAEEHGVTHETARTDLAALEAHGALVRERDGRRHVFRPGPALDEGGRSSPRRGR